MRKVCKGCGADADPVPDGPATDSSALPGIDVPVISFAEQSSSTRLFISYKLSKRLDCLPKSSLLRGEP